MIRIGFASADPEDASFIASDAVREWMLRNNNWEIKMVSRPADVHSVDVLLLPSNMMNKLAAAIDLSAQSWVMISARKSDAYRAWQLDAAYFLLRPFTLVDFQKALTRGMQCYSFKCKIVPPVASRQPLELLLTKGRKFSVQEEEILFLEARGEVTCVHLILPGQEKLIATRNLGYWERQLSKSAFLRVHKKYLINIGHVTELLPEAVKLSHYTLPVAKRRRKAVEEVFSAQQNRHSEGQKNLPAYPVFYRS